MLNANAIISSRFSDSFLAPTNLKRLSKTEFILRVGFTIKHHFLLASDSFQKVSADATAGVILAETKSNLPLQPNSSRLT